MVLSEAVRVRRASLIMVGALACLALSPVAAAGQAPQSLFGQWWVDHAINTFGYLEPHRFLLTLSLDWSFNYTIQSLRFPRRTETIGTFTPIQGMQNAYRFVVKDPKPEEMKAWNARMTLLSPSVMLYEDLVLGGRLQYRKVQ